MVARLLDRALLEQVGDKAVEMCSPSAFFSHGFPISYVVDRLLDRALLKRVRGKVLENSPSASRSAFILRFPKVINSLMYGHVHATKISLRNYDSAYNVDELHCVVVMLTKQPGYGIFPSKQLPLIQYESLHVLKNTLYH